MEHFIGIDIGGTKTAVCLVTPDGRIVAREQFPTRPTERRPQGVLEDIRGTIAACYARTLSCPRGDALAIGVSCGGPLDPERGIIGPAGHSPPNLPGWVELDLRAFFEGCFPDLPFHVDNDASNLALGEYVFGGGTHYERMGILLLGTGVGGGMVVGGRLLRGVTGNNTEFGQQVVLIRPGPARRVVRLREALSAELSDTVDLLSASVANAANFLDPARVIVEGTRDVDLDALRTAARRRVLNPLFRPDGIEVAGEGVHAALENHTIVHPSSRPGRVCADDGLTWAVDFGSQIVVLETDSGSTTPGWITLEDLCSGKGIVARMRALGGRAAQNPGVWAGDFSAQEVFRRAAEGDPLAARILEETAFLAAIGIANIAALMRPQAVFLCGGVCQGVNESQHIDFIRLIANNGAAICPPDERPAILPTRLGRDAGDLSSIAYWRTEGRTRLRASREKG